MTPAVINPVRAVIFDMDGLLVDTVPIWRQVGNGAFAALGVDIAPLAKSGAVMGLSVVDAMAVFRNYAGWPASEHPDLEERIIAGVVDAIHHQLELKPGADQALDFCDAAGLLMAVASGSSTPIIEAVLDRFDLAKRFTAVCSAAAEPRGKPHPGVFLSAAAAMGVAPEDCLVLEDAVSGCIAGKAASMRVIAVPDGPAVGDPRLAIADLVVVSLEELTGEPARAVMGLRLNPPDAAR
ncbi:MAG: hexitol phosphatase HxpB [Acidimicrobiales bacterium]